MMRKHKGELRQLSTWKGKYKEHKKKLKDFNKAAKQVEKELLAYFRSPEGLKHIADSVHRDKTPEEVTYEVMKTVYGWVREDERNETVKGTPKPL